MKPMGVKEGGFARYLGSSLRKRPVGGKAVDIPNHEGSCFLAAQGPAAFPHRTERRSRYKARVCFSRRSFGWSAPGPTLGATTLEESRAGLGGAAKD